MNETPVYRDVIGNFDLSAGCGYELDLEIVKKEGPATRQRTRDRMNYRLYRLVLIFTSRTSRAVSYHRLSWGEVFGLEAMSLHGFLFPKKFIPSRRNNFLLSVGWLKTKKDVLTLTYTDESKTDYRTAMDSYSLTKIMMACRALRYLCRHDMMEVNYPELHFDTAADVMTACAEYAVKYAVDFYRATKYAGVQELDTHEYWKTLREIMDKEYGIHFKEDVTSLYNRAKSVFGLSEEISNDFLDAFLSKVFERPNRFNYAPTYWWDTQVFVRGLWKLHFG